MTSSCVNMAFSKSRRSPIDNGAATASKVGASYYLSHLVLLRIHEVTKLCTTVIPLAACVDPRIELCSLSLDMRSKCH